MTSQISIGNQNGIVVASDTMVSWSDYHETKTVPDTSKIFDLGFAHQVVVTNCGYTSLGSLSFSTLMREWLVQLAGPFPTLEEYAHNFVDWVPDGVKMFGLDEGALAEWYFCQCLCDLDRNSQGELLESLRGLSKDASEDARQAAEKRATEAIAKLDFGDEQYGDISGAVLRQMVFGADSKFNALDHFRQHAEIQWPFSDAFENVVEVAILRAFESFIPNPPIVLNFSGFGTAEPLGGCITVGVRGVFGGKLRSHLDSRCPSPNDLGPYWHFAAQKSAMEAFLEGVDSDESVWIGATAMDILSEKFKFGEEKNQVFAKAFFEALNEHYLRDFVRPAREVLSDCALPGLIRYADALVHMQSLRSVSSDREATVGGVIEVVSITRQSGVQWHRRLNAQLDRGSAHVLI